MKANIELAVEYVHWLAAYAAVDLKSVVVNDHGIIKFKLGNATPSYFSSLICRKLGNATRTAGSWATHGSPLIKEWEIDEYRLVRLTAQREDIGPKSYRPRIFISLVDRALEVPDEC